MEKATLQSLDAIKKYIKLNKQNDTRHLARILISSKRKTVFNGVLFIYTMISVNKSYLIVEGNNEYERNFPPKYSTNSDLFSIVGSTLIIKSKDIQGNDITVNIS